MKKLVKKITSNSQTVYAYACSCKGCMACRDLCGGGSAGAIMTGTVTVGQAGGSYGQKPSASFYAK